ncbi:hypothetical protein NUU61_004978 [Penicillium alfredii]|uniref:37S ribosomal protein Rsm22 n=1 Tax=Penicillium alfredii TaxID=1506179 RepID=A0A9W9F8P2_9EURO|nr:uncharacterized protein NUU61_004978 [Penicillium alfredii]KAJ5095622.1 hypothetical protein NUU61_004978 [Penicillium alfredii]
MLSRPSASRATCPSSRDLLRTFAARSGSRQLCGAANWGRLNQSRSIARRPSPPVASNSLSRETSILKHVSPQRHPGHRASSTAAAPDSPEPPNSPQPIEIDTLRAIVDRISNNEAEIIELLYDLDMIEVPEEDMEIMDLVAQRDEHGPQSWVNLIRQRFGDKVPEGLLNGEEIQLYTRLYGEPIIQEEEFEPTELEEEEEDFSDQLLREDGDGGWEEVEYQQDPEAEAEDDIPVVYDMENGPQEKETIAMQRTREVAEQLGGDIMLEQFQNEAVPESAPRFHPLTLESKFRTDPSTIHLPKNTVTGPISIILSEFSNRHISETAHRVFGGPGLPHSTTTAPPRAQLRQLPIPLHVSQHHMGEMEANAYIAALYPGIYASVLSVLVEIRKRLGTDWIRRLISQEGGPNVLDAGGGGAGILAWREVLRAEWELMVPDHPKGAPIPMGRSTVLTGSEALRLRTSAMLDNTSFLPRLPDYVHVREKPTLDDSRTPAKRKQYDVIIAPHSLLGFSEEYERKEYVQNLWSLLNPNGGVLILLEKGRQKGFEAISGAREMLLKRHIASPGSTEYDNFLESPDMQETVEKEPGMIIAPCTNHSTCPMHNPAGPTKGRRDYCHFEQRYIRPPFLQRIMGAKDRNHEDLKFSYLAVQRGVDLRQERGVRQDTTATDAAFEGFEHSAESTPADPSSSSSSAPAFHPLALPRAVYAPMKRRGHVIFDLCTPAGKIERWTVPRSFSRQAYRDARKANWGDLWALGAKTRIPRNLNLGDKHGEGKKERLARRAAQQAATREANADGEFDEMDLEKEDELEQDFEDDQPERSQNPGAAACKKGLNVPSWKKQLDKKRARQAMKRESAVGAF